MSSLRDQLLGLGFKPAPKPERKPEAAAGAKPPRKPHGKKPHDNKPSGSVSSNGPSHEQRPRPHTGSRPKPPRSCEEMDLAKAYAIRAQQEKDERIAAEKARQEEARLRREAKARLETLLQGRALNDAAAELVRHFDYGGKIKRIHVTEVQLRQLNAGELGVIQLNGRYLLVDAPTLAEAEGIFPQAVALKVDPDAPAEADPYADPKYQVPDDLVW